MARDIEKTQKNMIEKNVVFNKQKCNRIAIIKQSDGTIKFSGHALLFSDIHDHKGSEDIVIKISEYKKTEGEEEDLKTEIVPAVTVQDVIDGIENFEKEKPDLTKLKLDDFLASIVHENLA